MLWWIVFIIMILAILIELSKVITSSKKEERIVNFVSMLINMVVLYFVWIHR